MRISLLIVLFVIGHVFGQSEKPHGQLYVHLHTSIENDTNQAWQKAETLPFLTGCPACLYRVAFPKLDLGHILELTTSQDLNITELKQRLEEQDAISIVELIPQVHSCYVPNDMDSTRDYYLPRVRAPEAWDSTRGDSNIVIAVVDNAIMVAHEELQDAIWHNPREIPGDGIDNDRNGWVDDVAGWDVADNDNNPAPSGRAFRHGTHIAGLIAAAADNGTGAAGLAHGCKILPVKVASDNGFADSYPLSNALRGVAYALSMRAPVVCMAWGGTDSLLAAHQLMERGRERGSILIAAAGNGPGDTNPATNDSTLEYPASYRAVVSVAATDEADVRAIFTTANRKVDLCAPGNLLYAPVPSVSLGSSYTRLRGSSQATAVASAAFGLLLSQRPCLQPADAIDIMKLSCTDIRIQNPTDFHVLGAGRIDIAAAIQALGSPISGTTDFVVYDSIGCTGHIQLCYTGGACPDSLEWRGPGGIIQQGRAPVFLLDSSGTYSFCLKVWQHGLVDSICKPQRFDFIRAINVSPGDTSIRHGDSLLLTVDGPAGLYTWEPANIFKRSAVGDSIWAFPQDSASITVMMSGAGACLLSDSIFVNVTQPNSIEPALIAEINIFPQPIIKGFYVEIPLPSSITGMTLFDIQGRKVWGKEKNLQPGNWIALPETLKGVHILEIKGPGYLFRKQVQIQ